MSLSGITIELDSEHVHQITLNQSCAIASDELEVEDLFDRETSLLLR